MYTFFHTFWPFVHMDCSQSNQIDVQTECEKLYCFSFMFMRQLCANMDKAGGRSPYHDVDESSETLEAVSRYQCKLFSYVVIVILPVIRSSFLTSDWPTSLWFGLYRHLMVWHFLMTAVWRFFSFEAAVLKLSPQDPCSACFTWTRCVPASD